MNSKLVKIGVKFFLLLIIFSYISIISVNAQNLKGYEEQQFRLGESYENSGNYEEASRIFKELYEANTNNETVFNAYYRCYDFLHQYTDFLPVAKNFAESNPSVSSLSKLASLYWKTGNPKEADETWDILIKKYGKVPEVYIDLALEQIALRQYEKGIATLLQGRKHFNQKDLFADYLSRYYPMIGDYKAGADEILLLAISPEKSSLAKGRLYLYEVSDESKAIVLEILKAAVEKNPSNYALLDTYAWFLKLIKNYDGALSAYIKIDNLKNTQGSDIYNFAASSQRDGEYAIAEKAFNYILTQESMKRNHANAMYGMVKCIEQQILNNDNVSKEQILDVIKKYDMMIANFPADNKAEEAQFNAAILYYQNLNDNAEAIKRFEILLEKSRNQNMKTQVNNELGEIYVIKGDLEKAQTYFNATVKTRNAPQELQNVAAYNLALIEYFTGDLDSAQTMFNSVATMLESNMSNDAIEKSSLIENNKTQIQAIGYYRNADYQKFLKKYADAAKNYLQASDAATEDAFIQQSLVKAAEMYKLNNDSTAVLSTWKKLVNDFSGGIYADLALYEYAQILQHKGQNTEAMEYYTKLLMDYPRSIYVPEARKKARALRDSMKEPKI